MIQGYIKDKVTGDPLEFAGAYFVDGSGNQLINKPSSLADASGFYSLMDIDPGDIIRFSIVGYTPKDITYSALTPSFIDILLEPGVDLPEAVIRPEKKWYQETWFKILAALIVFGIVVYLIKKFQ